MPYQIGSQQLPQKSEEVIPNLLYDEKWDQKDKL